MSGRRGRRLLWLLLGGGGVLLAALIALLELLLYHPAGPGWVLEWIRSSASLEIEVEGVEGRLAGPLKIHGLRLGDEGFSMGAEAIDLRWRPAALLRGELHLQSLSLSGIKVRLFDRAPDAVEPTPSDFDGSLLPLALRLDRLALTEVEIERPAAGDPLRIESLSLKAQSRGGQLVIEPLKLVTPELELKAEGGVGLSSPLPLDLTLSWRFAPTDGPQLQGGGEIRGDLRRLRVGQRVEGVLSGQVEGELNDMTGAFSWDIRARVQKGELGEWLTDFPLRLSGELRSHGVPDRIALEAELDMAQPEYGDAALKLDGRYAGGRFEAESLQILTPAGGRIEGAGHYIPDNDLGRFELDLSWRDLRWPLQGERPRVESAQGDLRLSGRPQAFDGTLAMTLRPPGEPVARIEAESSGNLRGISLRRLLIGFDRGKITGEGEIAWRPTFSWRLRLDGRDIDPALWLSELPGRLDFVAQTRGSADAAGVGGEFRLQRLSGRVRDYPVTAAGSASMDRQAVRLDGLHLTSAANRIEIDGRVADRFALDWRIDAPELQAFWPGLGGRLQGSGRVEGPRQAPRMRMQLKGERLALKDNRVAALRLQSDLDLSDKQAVALELHASDLRLAAGDWERLDLQLTGSLPSHRLSLNLSGDGAPRVGLRAAAGWSEDNLWRGRIESLDLTPSRELPWRLSESVEFAIGGHRQRLDDLCLTGGEASLCGAFANAPASGWRARLEAKRLPLAILQPWLPEGLKIEGESELHAELAADTRGHPRGIWRLRLPEGRLGFDLKKDAEVIDFAGGEIEGGIDEKGAEARLDLPLASLGALRGEVALPGFDSLIGDPGEQAVRGRLSLGLRDLSRLSTLFPRLQNAQGEIAGDFTLAGTLLQPALLGDAELRGGALDIPELGLELREIALRASSSTQGQLTLQGALRSGQGRVNLQGQVELDARAGLPARLRLSGSELTVANLPEAEIRVSPELNFVRDLQGSRLTGRLEIPYARLRPRKLPSTAVTASSDLVVVGGDEPVQRPVDLRLDTELRVVLGDRVSFDGFGLRGRLTGQLLLIDEAKRPVLGRGRIGIREGTYRAYGQDLKIERGYALFVNSPVDNPGLDVRAVREIDEVTAGVLVAGTLKSPKIDLFSSPNMAESDILSYLLTGRPPGAGSGQSVGIAAALKATGAGSVAEELGRRFGLEELRLDAGNGLEEASVVAGTYLSPRLYLQYINELASRETKVRMRYDINKRLQLEAETGKTQAGDLYYTFDR